MRELDGAIGGSNCTARRAIEQGRGGSRGHAERDGFPTKAAPCHGGTGMSMRLWTRHGECNLTHRFPSPPARLVLRRIMVRLATIKAHTCPTSRSIACKARTRHFSGTSLTLLRLIKQKGTLEGIDEE